MAIQGEDNSTTTLNPPKNVKFERQNTQPTALITTGFIWTKKQHYQI